MKNFWHTELNGAGGLEHDHAGHGRLDQEHAGLGELGYEDYGEPYLIFVIFFVRAKFLENKIYTEIYTVNCQFTQ